jgi:hypothetical protein
MQEGAVLEQNAGRAPSRQDSDALLALPSDHYSRYALTQTIIDGIRAQLGTPALRILDVGGHSSPLAHFLPNDSVVLLDVEPVGTVTALPLKCDDYIQGSGAALPFRDGSFDVVTAHDTLEHIPRVLRGEFLREIVRVGRRFVILTGPVWQAAVAEAEARIDRFVREITGAAHPFLAEHIEFGLPQPAEIEEFFQERSLEFRLIPAGDVKHWMWELAVDHYLAALPSSDPLRAAINRFRNTTSTPGDLTDGVNYRTAYIVALDPEVAPLIPEVANRAAELRSAGQTPRANDDSLLAALQSHGAALRIEMSRLHDALYNAERRAYELQGTHDELAQSLGDREAQVREQQEIIAARDEELLQERVRLRKLERSVPGRIAASGPYRWLDASAGRVFGKRGRKP